MSRPALYTPEEALERRRAGVRKSVAAHAERLKSMTRLEQAAWKARETLGDHFVAYTPAEADAVARLRAQIAEIQGAAEALNSRIQERLERQVGKDPRLAPLLAEIVHGTLTRLELPPF